MIWEPRISDVSLGHEFSICFVFSTSSRDVYEKWRGWTARKGFLKERKRDAECVETKDSKVRDEGARRGLLKKMRVGGEGGRAKGTNAGFSSLDSNYASYPHVLIRAFATRRHEEIDISSKSACLMILRTIDNYTILHYEANILNSVVTLIEIEYQNFTTQSQR